MAIVWVNYFSPASSQGLNIFDKQPATITVENAGMAPANNGKKRFWRAAGEWAMAQALPWASNRFIRKANFARVSFKSIFHNMAPNNQQFDDNKFFNNQFSHPYQGSLYFNAFRSNGYNFWESVPAVFAGTITWETIAETHLPAPNDIINTSLGGIVFGEMSTRLSKIILRRKHGKSTGTIRESLSFVSNPMHGLNRILDKEWAKKNEASGMDDTPVSLVTDAGVRLIKTRVKHLSNKIRSESFGRIQLQYGNPYTNSKTPFNNFSVVTEIGNSDSAKANVLQIEGGLYSTKIKQTTRSVHVFNISMNYDFFQHSSFVYGAQSFRANLFSRINFSNKFQLQCKAGAGIIALASVPNTYLYYGEGRNYNYCSGFSLQAGAGINIANKLFYNFQCSGAAVKTINGFKSVHLLYSTSSELRVTVYKNLTISVASSNYFFNGYYADFATVSDHHSFRHFGLGYKIML